MSSRHDISNDFTIQNIQNVKDQHLSMAMRTAAAGTIPCEKNVLLNAQSNEIFLFDTTYSVGSSASPFSFWSGTQDLPFSLSSWIRLTGAPSATAAIVSKGRWAANEKREWLFGIAANRKAVIQIYDESADSYIGKVTSSALALNTWYHVVMTYSGNETSAGCKIYVNGTAVSIADNESGTYSGMDTSAGGYYGNVGSTTMKAHMSDISVWSVELSATDVASIYNSGSPSNLTQEPPYIADHGSLVCWWRMGSYHLDFIKSGGGSSASSDNIINDITGNSRPLVPYTGFDGDEIVTTNAIGSARAGDDADNANNLPRPIIAPFSLSNRGVPNLRERNSAYKVTKG